MTEQSQLLPLAHNDFLDKLRQTGATLEKAPGQPRKKANSAPAAMLSGTDSWRKR
jgi:hypothetical protein